MWSKPSVPTFRLNFPFQVVGARVNDPYTSP